MLLTRPKTAGDGQRPPGKIGATLKVREWGFSPAGGIAAHIGLYCPSSGSDGAFGSAGSDWFCLYLASTAARIRVPRDAERFSALDSAELLRRCSGIQPNKQRNEHTFARAVF